MSASAFFIGTGLPTSIGDRQASLLSLFIDAPERLQAISYLLSDNVRRRFANVLLESRGIDDDVCLEYAAVCELQAVGSICSDTAVALYLDEPSYHLGGCAVVLEVGLHVR